jgi:hypothetical protein
MKVGNLKENHNMQTVVIMKDGSVNLLQTELVISYDKNRTYPKGTGVFLDNMVDELNRHGNIHIAKDRDYANGFIQLEAKDISRIYSVSKEYKNEKNMITIVPPKKGIKKVLAYLSNL